MESLHFNGKLGISQIGSCWCGGEGGSDTVCTPCRPCSQLSQLYLWVVWTVQEANHSAFMLCSMHAHFMAISRSPVHARNPMCYSSGVIVILQAHLHENTLTTHAQALQQRPNYHCCNWATDPCDSVSLSLFLYSQMSLYITMLYSSPCTGTAHVCLL